MCEFDFRYSNRADLGVTDAMRAHKDPMAMKAVKQHKVACFYVDGGSLTSWGKLILFCRCCIRITTIREGDEGPLYLSRHA